MHKSHGPARISCTGATSNDQWMSPGWKQCVQDNLLRKQQCISGGLAVYRSSVNGLGPTNRRAPSSSVTASPHLEALYGIWYYHLLHVRSTADQTTLGRRYHPHLLCSLFTRPTATRLLYIPSSPLHRTLSVSPPSWSPPDIVFLHTISSRP